MQNLSAWGSGEGPWGGGDAACIGVSGRLAVEWIPGVQTLTLRLEGELDLETSPELDRQLAAVDPDRVQRLVIDLHGVSFMDSRGLSSIVRADQAAQERGYTVVLRRGSNQVQRLFALTGVDERLTFDDG